MIAGNGGSAADAQHIAGEFIGRFMINRRPLPAIALTTDTSVTTCISNDYHFDEIFVRQVEALGASGDILWVLSTSGNSINILKAMNAAKKRNMHILAFLGNEGGECLQKADAHLVVKSPNIPRIQEVHLFAYHIIIEHVERLLFQTGEN
jgi:D-sedoheptulose 7-phosphate isomerase